MFDPMSELGGSTSQDSSNFNRDYSDQPRRSHGGGGGFSGRNRGGFSSGHGDSGRGDFATEVHSVSIHAKERTFYLDLKESSKGKFLKVSEKSRNGRKSTIMLDSGDIDSFLNALQEIKQHL
jgi:hypothetical protein